MYRKLLVFCTWTNTGIQTDRQADSSIAPKNICFVGDNKSIDEMAICLTFTPQYPILTTRTPFKTIWKGGNVCYLLFFFISMFSKCLDVQWSQKQYEVMCSFFFFFFVYYVSELYHSVQL